MLTAIEPLLFQDEDQQSVIQQLERLSEIWKNQSNKPEPSEFLCRYLKYEPAMKVLLEPETIAWLHKCYKILEKIPLNTEPRGPDMFG